VAIAKPYLLNSMSDLFHKQMPLPHRRQIFELMEYPVGEFEVAFPRLSPKRLSLPSAGAEAVDHADSRARRSKAG
jgi:hypothetical protein